MRSTLLAHTCMLTDYYYFPEILAGYRHVFRETEIDAVHISDDAILKNEIEPGTAIAYLLSDSFQHARVDLLAERGHLVVAINNYIGANPVPQISIDDAGGIVEAMDYLVSLGHQNIGFIRGMSDNIDADLRLHGFREGVKKHGLVSAPEAGDDFMEEAGYAAAKILLSHSSRPTALITASDFSASGAIRAAREAGLSVPLDLSVIGFGDFSVPNHTAPAITTIRQCRFELGQAAGLACIRMLRGEKINSEYLKTSLVLRESTAYNLIPDIKAA